jgi:hypothetical protein
MAVFESTETPYSWCLSEMVESYTHRATVYRPCFSYGLELKKHADRQCRRAESMEESAYVYMHFLVRSFATQDRRAAKGTASWQACRNMTLRVLVDCQVVLHELEKAGIEFNSTSYRAFFERFLARRNCLYLSDQVLGLRQPMELHQLGQPW